MTDLSDRRIISMKATCTECQATIYIQATPGNGRGSLPPEKTWRKLGLECPVCRDLLAPDEIVLQGSSGDIQ